MVKLGRGRNAFAVGFASVALLLSGAAPAFGQEAAPEEGGSGAESSADEITLVFPVLGDHSFSDSFGAPRPGGRTHKGVDIFAEKLTPVVAVAGGVVVRVAEGNNSGRYIVIRHDDGSHSYYLHLNNDTPGTDDGAGWQPVSGISEGATVAAGAILNYVGDSGNAETTPPHLHFELHAPGGAAVNPHPYLLAAQLGTPVTIAANQAAPETAIAVRAVDPYAGAQFLNTGVVGHVDLGGGFNADVALHDDRVYLGSWGRPGACPSHGVRVLDVTHPSAPVLLSSFATDDEFPGTYTENAWVGSVEMASFSGDLAVVAVRLCDNTERGRFRDGFRGVAVYDVTDPAVPVLMSTLDTGPRTQGVHEMAVSRTPTGSLRIAVTVLQSHLHHPDGAGDLRIIDLTDLRGLVEVADWDLRRDGPPDVVTQLMEERGEEELHAHSVWLSEDGDTAYVSHWDAGTVMLDLAVPETPRFVELTGFTNGDEGNGHSVWMVEDSNVVIQNSEDLYPFDEEGEHDHGDHHLGWGYQRIYQDMEMVSVFATENAVPGEDGEIGTDGFYTVHNAEVIGSTEYASWYSDGLRIVDISDPATPTEIGYFIPPPKPDPQGYWMAPDGSASFPMVWGVYVAKDLIYLSDINSGLWVVRFDDPNAEEWELTPSTAEALIPDEPAPPSQREPDGDTLDAASAAPAVATL